MAANVLIAKVSTPVSPPAPDSGVEWWFRWTGRAVNSRWPSPLQLGRWRDNGGSPSMVPSCAIKKKKKKEKIARRRAKAL